MYPGNNAFLKNIQVELEQQIPRIAGHPAVVLFNGNNEVDVAWKNWGFQSTYHLTAADCKLIETYYNRVFKELIPTTVKKYTPLPYEHTSPLSNWGKDEYFNHGTQHYWGVWHGNDPIGDFATKIGRFNAEYGFQSFPELSTIRSFSDSSDWSLNSPVMKYHQKSYVGNAMIAKHSDSLFGATTDFKRFVYYSQLTQAEAVRLAVTGHRLNFPRCTGSLYWQFNDCWPAPTWSSIDYYGNWKALQYTMKQTFADVTVLKQIDSTNVPHFWLLSDSPNGFHGTLTCEVYRFNGELLERMNCSPILDSTGKLEVFSSELEKWQQQPYFIRITGNIKNDTTILLTAIHRVSKDEHQRIPIAFMQFKEINTVEHTGKLTVYFSDMVEDFWISSRKLGIHFVTNFEDFLPGSYTFPFTFDELPELNDFETYYRY
jgi:beta-mannosidase